jgi:hypothetical protein
MNWRGSGLAALLALSLLPVTGPRALAQDREFAVGVGYGHLFWDGSHTDELEEQGGLVLDGRLTWAITPNAYPGRPELRAGVGLDLAFYSSHDDNSDFEVDENGDVFANATDYTQLSVLAPQIELSWRQPIINENWYLEPGIAGVFMLGNYVKGQEFFWFVDEDVNEWRVGGGGKLFLRLAYTTDRWSVGAEGSYGYGWLDFGHDIGGDIQQGYFGFFYAHKF